MAELFVFGDSLSDNGNLFAAQGGFFPPFPYFEGRLSNGIVAVEYLDNLLTNYEITPRGESTLPSNFAFAGATTGRSNSFDDDLLPIPIPDSGLPGLLDQIDTFAPLTSSLNADASDLYLVWAGPNNFLDVLGSKKAVDPVFQIRQGALDLGHAVTQLYNLGARDIVVPNMLNLGRLPASALFRADAAAVTRAFNAAVALEIDNLSFDITAVDVFSKGEAIAANPSDWGFTNTTDPAFIPPTLPVSNANEYFFWDVFHPTTHGHEVLAATIYDTINDPTASLTFNDLRGTNRSDTLTGTNRRDNIDGFAGNDIIRGLGQGDRLEGWNGNDQIYGDLGNDILSGGAGADLILGGQGHDVAFGGNRNDRMFGQGGNDILIGDCGSDRISGGAGRDYLWGAEDNDTLLGEAGHDILNGGNGVDSLLGGTGGDRLDGGIGDDILVGDLGLDQFVLRPDGGNDVVQDFVQGQDLLDVSNFGFTDFDTFVAGVTLSASTITFNVTDSVQLPGITATSLTATDFIFASTAA